MGSWADLPQDLIVCFAKKIKSQEDFLAFRGVCPSWRAAAPKEIFHQSSNPQIPLLMFPDQNEGQTGFQEFHSLYKGNKIRNVLLPEATKRGSRYHVFEPRGWLISITECGEVNLLHPFSGARLKLPRYEARIDMIVKGVLTSANLSDLEIMVREKCYDNIYIWRNGARSWTKLESRNRRCLLYPQKIDMAYFSETFKEWESSFPGDEREYDVVYKRLCGVNYDGQVEIFDVDYMADPEALLCPRELAKLPKCRNSVLPHQSYYVVASPIQPFVIVRKYYLLGIDKREKFQVFEVGKFRDELRFRVDGNGSKRRKTWKEMTNLGEKAIFLSHRSGSTLVKVSSFPGKIKANHIYFIKDNRESGSWEVCGYNLEDQSIEPVFKCGSYPPIFVTPSFY